MSILDDNITEVFEEQASKCANEIAKLESVAKGIHMWIVQKSNWMNNHDNRNFIFDVYTSELVNVAFKYTPLPKPTHTEYIYANFTVRIGVGVMPHEIVETIMTELQNWRQMNLKLEDDFPQISYLRFDYQYGYPYKYKHIFRE